MTWLIMLVVLVIFFISLGSAIRLGLVFTGMLKGPILSTFEKYGPEEPIYYPVPQMFMWPGGVVLSSGAILRDTLPLTLSLWPLGLVLLICAVITYSQRDRLQEYWAALPVYPGWYTQLLQQTSRGDRRRIAYMWLRLPRRTRLLYNANHRLFFVWAEQVIVSTLR